MRRSRDPLSTKEGFEGNGKPRREDSSVGCSSCSVGWGRAVQDGSSQVEEVVERGRYLPGTSFFQVKSCVLSPLWALEQLSLHFFLPTYPQEATTCGPTCMSSSSCSYFHPQGQAWRLSPSISAASDDTLDGPAPPQSILRSPGAAVQQSTPVHSVIHAQPSFGVSRDGSKSTRGDMSDIAPWAQRSPIRPRVN